MPSDVDFDGGDDKVARGELLSLIRSETADLRRSVDEVQVRVENVERRLNVNYVKVVNVCSKIVSPKTDWLSGIRKMFVEMDVLPSVTSSDMWSVWTWQPLVRRITSMYYK
ncbi:hypothetical protein PRIPAC_83107 [Pristionchus pacificus]|uniref:Uncharacterized protein n=1 Tax=Pristionchus pacificus TaxID=54126 RepID=A0A2A6CCF8_PRIPA|nr:hypothetical protein PRIPAC_83107 [Pristionchus pacificus]|eukprot:PDM75780.1 hypothetical protein PRIPAC_40159 [Pristionchus pacificus]